MITDIISEERVIPQFIKQRIRSFLTSIIGLLVYCFISILLISCNDADIFYAKLNKQPEVISNFKAAYFIGDTVTISGRLNPGNNLSVHVGDLQAPLVNITKIYPDLDAVKIIITESMGVGESIPITLTSDGITIPVTSIEIVGDANIAVLNKQLQLVKVADIPAKASIVYCRNSNGNTYFWDAAEKKLFKIDSKGNKTEVFNEYKCKEAGFSIDEFNAGGISPDERYFYFSAKIKEENQDYTLELYRFCRFELPTEILPNGGGLISLNRTEYSLMRSRRTLQAAQPFEGNVDAVKIYKITSIWPDSAGNVYCNLMDHFLTMLGGNNHYSYLVDFIHNNSFEGGFIPQIYNSNSEVKDYYSRAQVHQLLPGLKAPQFNYIDPETKIGYSKDISNRTLTLTDLFSSFQTGKYMSNYLKMSQSEIPYASASLSTFNGGLVDNIGNSLPVSGKLIGLYFREQINSYFDSFYQKYELPALCEIDLENKRSRRYAPKRLILNGFDIKSNYQLLSLDKEGMIYMVANGGTVIVKTSYVE